MSTSTVIVLCDRKRGSATAWNQAQGKSFCILILHKEKSIAPSCRALLAPKHRQDQSQWESWFLAVIVPRVEGFRAPYATDEQHRKAADNLQRPLALH
jgi:hypothetical protein